MFIKNIARHLKRGVKLAAKSPVRAGLFGLFTGTIMALGLLFNPMLGAENVNFSSVRDCDSNAVMRCGAMSISELQNKYNGNASVRHIFDYFDISKKDIQNIKQYARKGHVTKSGNVVVGGKIVANNARTAGRLHIPGSTKVTHQGTTFYTRTPSVSFVGNNLDAFVAMDNGVFMYAILASCGNPVKAHPTTKPAKPNYEIEKTVRVGNGNWRENASINYGEIAEFRVVVKSTGAAPVANLFVRDKLPADLEYINGSLTKDGVAANATAFFGDKGVKVARLAKGDKVVFQFKAGTKAKTQPNPCQEKKVTNWAHMTADSLPAKKDSATIDLKCKVVHKPDYKIVKQVQRKDEHDWSDSVTVPNGSIVRYRVVVTNTGEVAITNLIVSDKLPNGVTYIDNTLEQDGKAVSDDNKFFGSGINAGTLNVGKSITFVFKATVGSADKKCKCKVESLKNIATADGDELGPISDDATVDKQCPEPPKPPKPPKPQPRYTCDLLTATSLGNRKFKFNTAYTATGGATLSTATYNFGDSSGELITNLLTTVHQYDKDGTYTANVKLTFMVDGKSQTVTSEDCSVTVSSVTPPDMCPIPGKEHLPADSPECSVTPPPAPPEKEETPTPPAEPIVPEEVPNTGPGGIVGLFTGSTALGTLGYRFWVIRRRQ